MKDKYLKWKELKSLLIKDAADHRDKIKIAYGKWKENDFSEA